MAISKSKPKKKKKTKFSPWLIFVLVIILIALISMGIGYYLTNNENPNIVEWAKSDEKTETATEPVKAADDEKATKTVEKTALEGSWVSMYDGSILTFTGLNFALDLPSVDSPEKITGKIALENTIVTFYNTGGKKVCIDVEGHYQFTFQDDELNFKIIKDQCASRKERMTANWFKL
ncbi:MAG TPA: hypothetical protein VIN10_03420 [Bacteroidales bacterium]